MLLIIITCVIVSVFLLLKYFYFGNGSSKYGDRLDGIENVMITDEKKMNVVNKLKEDKKVLDAKVTVTGKIIYIRIVFNAGTHLDDAKSIAVKSLEEFSDEEMKFYDLNFTLKSDATDSVDGFTIMGAKNVNGSNLVWNNNNAVSEEE